MILKMTIFVESGQYAELQYRSKQVWTPVMLFGGAFNKFPDFFCTGI